MPGRFLPDTSLRSPTAVPSRFDLRTRVIVAELGPDDKWLWMPKPSTYGEMSISRIAARMDNLADAQVQLQIKVGGKLGFEAPLGLVHDAYDGHGLVSSGRTQTESIIGEFGKVLAKIDQALDRSEVAAQILAPNARAEMLGASMAALADALANLGRTGTSGLTFKVPVLVARHDLLEVLAASPLQGTARVYLYTIEKTDSR